MKKHISKILIFLLGVIVTVILTKAGDKIYPEDSEITINKVKDTIFVIDVTKDIQKEQLFVKSSELKKEIEHWKSIANQSTKNFKSLEQKINQLEQKQLSKTLDVESKSFNNVTEEDIMDLKKEIEELKQIKSNQLEFISDNGLNKVIPNIKTTFPNKNGYQYSGTTGLLVLDCPDFKNDEEYVDIDFLINDKDLLNQIATIFVSMTRIDEKGNYYQVYDNYYKPQFGYNHLRVRNVKSEKRTKYSFYYGLFLKSETQKVSPNAEGINCYFYK